MSPPYAQLASHTDDTTHVQLSSQEDRGDAQHANGRS